MNKRQVCEREECGGTAVGFIPTDGERGEQLLCDEHYTEAVEKGFFTCLIGEQVCPVCEGRSWKSLKIVCHLCKNTGTIDAAAELITCPNCNGSGSYVRPRRGRRRGSLNRKNQDVARAA